MRHSARNTNSSVPRWCTATHATLAFGSLHRSCCQRCVANMARSAALTSLRRSVRHTWRRTRPAPAHATTAPSQTGPHKVPRSSGHMANAASVRSLWRTTHWAGLTCAWCSSACRSISSYQAPKRQESGGRAHLIQGRGRAPCQLPPALRQGCVRWPRADGPW
jgi:hypothetical protein